MRPWRATTRSRAIVRRTPSTTTASFHDQGVHTLPARTAAAPRPRIARSAVAHAAQIEQRQVGALARLDAADIVAAQAAAPSTVAIAQRLRHLQRRRARGADACSSSACRASASMCELSFEALPSTPEPDRTTGARERQHRRASRTRAACSTWDSARSPTRARPSAPTSRAVEEDAVRQPGIAPQPAGVLQQIERAACRTGSGSRPLRRASPPGGCAGGRRGARASSAGRAHQLAAKPKTASKAPARRAASRPAAGRDISRSAARNPRRIRSSRCTTESGGRPPCLPPTLMLPRVGMEADADLPRGGDLRVDQLRPGRAERRSGGPWWWCSRRASAPPSRPAPPTCTASSSSRAQMG